jgi:hypothetical protein
MLQLCTPLHVQGDRNFTYSPSSLSQIYVYTLQSAAASHILFPVYAKFTYILCRVLQLHVYSFHFIASLRVHFAECRNFTYTPSILSQIYVYTLQIAATSHILLPFCRKFMYTLCRVPQLHIYSFHFIASLRISFAGCRDFSFSPSACRKCTAALSVVPRRYLWTFKDNELDIFSVVLGSSEVILEVGLPKFETLVTIPTENILVWKLVCGRLDDWQTSNKTVQKARFHYSIC